MDEALQTVVDPVCGMTVDPQTTPWRVEHDGQTHYFCSRGCMLDFEDDPQRYLEPDYRPSMPDHDGH